MSNWSPDIYKKAWHFATLAHEGQTYGGSEPKQHIVYLNHIGSVAMEVIWALQSSPSLDGDLAIQCALLHDVIEDTNFTFEDIEKEFGNSVAQGVLALTKNGELESKKDRIKDSLQRIKKQPKEIWMVKLADRITNLQAPPYYWEKEKTSAYYEEAILIYEELKEGNPALAIRLQKKIEEYKRFF